MLSLSDIEHVKKFDDQGKQGIVGLVRDKRNGEMLVYKISQFMNYIPQHEMNVMKGLSELDEICPNFCKPKYLVKLPINLNFFNSKIKPTNPFEESEHSLLIDVLFMEYVENIKSFTEFIDDKNIPIHIIISIIKQVLMAINIAQSKKFTHYDLHSSNILITKTEENAVNIYRFHDNTYMIPTYGYIPIIIDFGFSTIENCHNGPIYCPLAYTEAGYFSPLYDPIADCKIFLVSVLDDFRFSYADKYDVGDVHIFRNIVRNLFDSQSIDWKSGWDLNDDNSIIEDCLQYIENIDEESILFSKIPHWCMDIFNTLINYPMPNHKASESSLHTLQKSYECFTKEFVKIEREVNNTFQSLYIFRNIIDLVRNIYDDFVNDEKGTLNYFEKQVFDIVNSVAKFSRLQDVNYTKLLHGLLIFKNQLEIQLSIRLNEALKKKNKEYNRLECKSLKEIYCILDYNFQEKVDVKESLFVIYDIVNKETEAIQFDIDDELCDELGELTTLNLGREIMNMLQ